MSTFVEDAVKISKIFRLSNFSR